MKKLSVKSAVAGILIGVLITTGGVYAKKLTETIEVNYKDIKIYIDGYKINPKDANGKTVEAFIYNGTTYLPVRAVGEAFGKNVVWDSKTTSVYVGERNNIVQYLGEHIIASHKYEAIEYSTEKGDYFAMNGIKYNMGLKITDYHFGYALYDLNSQYSKITGIVGHVDGSYEDDGIINIFADNKLVKIIELSPKDSPVTFDIDVTNVMQLKITKADSNRGSYGLGNVVVK